MPLYALAYWLGRGTGVALLLDELWEVGPEEQVRALAERAAQHADLTDSGEVAALLAELRRMRAQEQVRALVARGPAQCADLTDPFKVAHLYERLEQAGMGEQARTLTLRLPVSGQFRLYSYSELRGDQTLSRYGLRPDGSPAPHWQWRDLD